MPVQMEPVPVSVPQVAAAYSDPAWWYDLRGFFILKTAYRGGLWSQVAFFQQNLGERHLEVAIGTGTLFELVLRLHRWRQGRRPSLLVGIDAAPAMLAGAKQRLARYDGLQLAVADAGSLEFPAGSFDSINVANAFHCFHEPDAVLRELARVLVAGGRLAMNVLTPPRGWAPCRRLAARVNAWGQKKGILVAPYEPDDVRRRLQAAGFAVEHERLTGNVYSVRASKTA